jgi:hypothetical protein
MKAKIKLYSIESSTFSFTHHIVVRLQKSERKRKGKEENLDYTYLLSLSSSSFPHLQPETLDKLLVKVKMLV